MSRRKVKAGVRVAMVPVPIALVIAQGAGEWVNAYGGTPREIEITQIGFTRGLICEVVVYGLDADGNVREKAPLAFSGDATGDIELDLDGGKRSAIEAIDLALGRALGFHADRMRRKGLRPDIRWLFKPEIYEDPARLAAARAELGIAPVALPSWRPGFEGREILRMQPGKMKGMLATFIEEFKTR